MGKSIPFWARVKDLIKAHKISQKDLAQYIDLNYNTLKNWIHFDRLPDAGTACAIASALGVTAEYLVWGIDGEFDKNHEKEVLTRKTAAANIRKLVKKIERDASLIG